MRTVLAMDDLLSKAVEKKLGGRTVVCSRQRMRDEGDDVVRELAQKEPCVLVIGGAKWNPLTLLELWRLPYETPVVLVLPAVTWSSTVRASRLDVFAVVPAGKVARKLPTAVASEALLAHRWLAERHPRTALRLLEKAPTTPPPSQQTARVLRLARE
jgi:hypothetical protein